MPNHVHLILAPATPEGLGRALGKAHRRYSAFVNARNRVTGHLFQARFSSVVMDEDHLMAAARYVAMNPVRARLVERAEDWPWSSVRAHLAGRDDGLVEVGPLLSRSGGPLRRSGSPTSRPRRSSPPCAPPRRSAALSGTRRFSTGSPRSSGAIRGRESAAASRGLRARPRTDAGASAKPDAGNHGNYACVPDIPRYSTIFPIFPDIPDIPPISSSFRISSWPALCRPSTPPCRDDLCCQKNNVSYQMLILTGQCSRG